MKRAGQALIMSATYCLPSDLTSVMADAPLSCIWGRPYSPWDGCCVCWRNDDRNHILLCDGCDAEMHVYCVRPPLSAIPTGMHTHHPSSVASRRAYARINVAGPTCLPIPAFSCVNLAFQYLPCGCAAVTNAEPSVWIWQA